MAIAVWRLATGNSFRTTAKTFAVGKSTAVTITHEFCKALVEIQDDFISFPVTPLEVGEAIEKFRSDVQCEIPQAIGAIDGTLIEIVAPIEGDKISYYARTKRYAVNTQALAGANLIFLHLATGYPGSTHDARMFRSSDIFTYAERGDILQYPEEIIENHRIKPLILGDGAYPLSTYLMKPYPQSVALTRDEVKFNKKLSGARVLVERAFGILKARYRILLKRLDSQITNVSDVIIACVVLHNFCQSQNDQYMDYDKILDELMSKERRAKLHRRQNNAVVGNAVYIRNILKRFVN